MFRNHAVNMYANIQSYKDMQYKTRTEYIDFTGKCIPIHFTGSPNCPTVHTTTIAALLALLAASIQKSPMKWLPEWYSVEVVSYRGSIAVIVYNATLKALASFNVTSLEPADTVYNISVIPCNMAGCNESCDAHSVQAESETAGTRGEMGGIHIHT